MEFRNLTPFPAAAFQGVEPGGERFHGVAVRQTLTWDAHGHLSFSGEQLPLCEQDACHEAPGAASVRLESDLCQFKPRCDVLVDGLAHAPGGRPASSFPVRLVVRGPELGYALPPRPYGLNPLMAPSAKDLGRWERDAAHVRNQALAGEGLLDKTLQVFGSHAIHHTLLGGWQFGKPTPVLRVPLRLEHAFGGQCVLMAAPAEADRVAKDERLSPLQQADHPARHLGQALPLAHQALQANPWGCGFVRHWHWQALGLRSVPAPQIVAPAHPLTAALLTELARAKAQDLQRAGPDGLQARLALCVAGLGIRPKGHPQRLPLAGTVDDAFIQGDAPLPPDFDFAVWNGAWPDQQTRHLHGDERIALVNLCAHDAPAAQADSQGNTVLRLRLPGFTCKLLLRLQSGEQVMKRMAIDTVFIEPELQRLSLVWRSTVPIDAAMALRAIDLHGLDAQRTREFDAQTQGALALLRWQRQHGPQPPAEAAA
jgi:hypothetical protein